MSQNLYDLPDPLPPDELFTDLIPDAGVKIERIVSSGQSTPEGQWYDEPRDEWVALLQGEATIAYDDGSEVTLQAGDHLLIPAHTRHRVAMTSESPPCIWLAVHGRLT
ncbi:MAG: cupin domain-containing protein [Chloroflexota bacterium]|nr:cupin domain-containing protein [Chloroflexota bacterium]MDE2968709.1 cupin domain-containing protein [Chloroflexota bacterium]